MIGVGIDIGSRTSKAVIVAEEGIKGYSLIPTTPQTEKVAWEALEIALAEAGLGKITDLNNIVATGYGRVIVPFAAKQVSEISCHAKGAIYLFPTARTLLDMGGQDCKAINCNEKGHVTNFAMNDKCAAGTGRFVELIANAFQIPLEEVGPLSLETEEIIPISSICSVFARSEALLLAREGVPKNKIFAGIHDALVNRVLGLVRKTEVRPDFIITGGIAKNIGFVARIESRLGMRALIPEEPQITGALGAAIFSLEEKRKEVL